MRLDEKESGQARNNTLVMIVIVAIVVVSAVAIGIYYGKMKGNNRNVASVGGTMQGDASQNQTKAKEHFEKGVNYSLKKEYDKAIAEYLESLKYNSGVAEVHSNLAFAYFDKGNPDMAIQEHKKAMELDPEHANAYYGMALIYEAKGNNAEAIKNWEAFLKLTQPHSLWWNKAQERLEMLKGDKSKR